jgi:VanZ family protein
VIVYCTAIFIQSSLPPPEALPSWPASDKLLHVAAYAVMGILAFRAFRTTRRGGDLKHVAVVSVLFSSLYGVSDELHQFFVPLRNAAFGDVAADVIGSAIGVFACYCLATRKTG